MVGSSRTSAHLSAVPLIIILSSSLQVNHLSTALLSLLLVPNMLKAAELHSSASRLVLVSSGLHFLVDIDRELVQSAILQTLGQKEFCTDAEMRRRYPVTKRTYTLTLSPLITLSNANNPLRQSSTSYSPAHSHTISLPPSRPPLFQAQSAPGSVAQALPATHRSSCACASGSCSSSWVARLSRAHDRWCGPHLDQTERRVRM